MPASQQPSVNPFLTQSASRSSPALRASVVTPDDAADLPVYAKALRVMNAGATTAALRVTYAGEQDDATTIDLPVSPGLTIEPSAVRRVWSTGTTPGLSIIAYLG